MRSQSGNDSFAKWEKEIQAFEKADQAQKPPIGANLFVGSSSFRLWTNLQALFPDKQVINRGFGGSQIVDSTHFADRIIFPHRPRVVLLYAGDNDLASGKSPEQVATDFKSFATSVHKALPMCTIVFVAIKPSPKRIALIEKARESNRLVEAYIASGRRMAYVDTFQAMLMPDGKPDPSLFVADELHMNAKGYALWVPLIRPHLK